MIRARAMPRRVPEYKSSWVSDSAKGMTRSPRSVECELGRMPSGRTQWSKGVHSGEPSSPLRVGGSVQRSVWPLREEQRREAEAWRARVAIVQASGAARAERLRAEGGKA